MIKFESMCEHTKEKLYLRELLLVALHQLDLVADCIKSSDTEGALYNCQVLKGVDRESLEEDSPKYTGKLWHELSSWPSELRWGCKNTVTLTYADDSYRCKKNRDFCYGECSEYISRD